MGHDIRDNRAHKINMKTQGSDIVAVEVYEPLANGV